MKKTLCTLLAVAAVGSASVGHAEPRDPCDVPSVTHDKAALFDGDKLLVLSDATMPASGFMDGRLNPGARIVRSARDTLTVLDLPLQIGRPRDPVPDAAPPVIGEVEADNSAVGPPFVVTASTDGRRAYVLRTRGNPPPGTVQVGDVLADLPRAAVISVLDIADPGAPRLLQTLEVGIDGQSISLSPDNALLALNTPEPGRNIVLRRVLADGTVGPELAAIHGSDAGVAVEDVGRVQWHPSGRFLANTLQMADEVRFYALGGSAAQPTLRPWGRAVRVGKYPAQGVFTPDGRYFLTSDLQWGEDVPGFSDDPPPGTVTAVRFDGERGLHRVTGSARTDVNPEGIGVSPNGRYVVTANLIRSFYPWDRERLSAESSLNLLELDAGSGKLSVLQRVPLDGILPEGIAFDRTGDHLAITLFDHFDPRYRRGGVEFFELLPLRGRCPSAQLVPTHVELEVAPGPHVLWLVR